MFEGNQSICCDESVVKLWNRPVVLSSHLKVNFIADIDKYRQREPIEFLEYMEHFTASQKLS